MATPSQLASANPWDVAPWPAAAINGARLSEEAYFALDAEGGRLIELVRGELEVLPMPSLAHQLMLKLLFRCFDAYVLANDLGEILLAPLPVRLFAGTIREPDLLFLSKQRLEQKAPYPQGVDLALEVVSPDAKSRKRDYDEKRRDYAQAGVHEYWIVDPESKTITVLVLEGDQYREHGVFRPGDNATSTLLPGLSLAVQPVFQVGEEAQ